ncbi:MAG: hypothetical protein ACRCYU_20155 [Nocardioides sp.]
MTSSSAPMTGLTVRWSLADCPKHTLAALVAYVEETSHARFTGLPGLSYKTSRARPGEWFEGCYVFDSHARREEFQRTFAATAAQAPGSRIVGSAPILIEECQVVAVAEGAGGFLANARC